MDEGNILFWEGKRQNFFPNIFSNHHILDKVYACPLLKRKAECMNNLDINQMHFGKLILKSEYEHIFSYLQRRPLRCDEFVDKEDGDGTHDETGEDPANRLGVLRVFHTVTDL